MKHIDAILVAAALFLGGCGGQEQDLDRETGGEAAVSPADSGQAAHAMADRVAAGHAVHDTESGDPEHDQHATEATGPAHEGHVGGAAPEQEAQHAGHARGVNVPAHGEHGARSQAEGRDGHAAHVAVADADAHAGHAPAAPDAQVSHADHAPAAPDSQMAHAGHAPAASDTQRAHAGHAAAPEAAPHAAHAAAPPAAMHEQHGAAVDTGHGAGHEMAMVDTSHGAGHEMAMFDLGRTGWMAIGMAQVFPTFSMAFPSDDDTPLAETAFYATQPAIMLNLESPQSRVSFRTTLNFEGITQPDGELTFGGWGEGFLDKRHPHTLVHEAMLSVNVWARDGGGFSLSAGKGFAPYGTDDPMSRPVLKYPTNHHLSQILERFTLNGVYSSPRWSVEVGVFGGNEPTGPYDFSNAESFANSWSARATTRFGEGAMGVWDWELSGSYGYVVEGHDDEESTTRLYNAALRHEQDHSFGRLYSLIEGSMSDPDHHDGYFSILGEASLFSGPHNPYARLEYATRPEYPREGAPGTDEFFRYDHDDDPIGSTRWLIATAGYGFTATSLPFSARPFVELQWNRVSADEGGIEPEALFGRSSFFGLSVGARVFLGGEPMRMGSYGVLDSMTLMHRMMMSADAAGGHEGH